MLKFLPLSLFSSSVKVTARILTLLLICCLPVLAAESSWRNSLNQGVRSSDRQEFLQAEKWFRRALNKMDEETHTADDKAQCLDKLANVLALQGKTEAAEITYQKSLAVLEQKYGKNSRRKLSELFALGSIYESEGDHKSAMKYYSQAITINEKINDKEYGSYSPEFTGSSQLSSNNSSRVGNRRNKQAIPSSVLEQQAALNSSMRLEKLLSNDKDLMKKEDSCDQDLLSIFKKELTEPIDHGGQPGQLAVSPHYRKSVEKNKSSQ